MTSESTPTSRDQSTLPPWDQTWVVIMAGGVGSRFWPLSRAARPKQLLDLFGDGAMLVRTISRLTDHIPLSRHLIVTGSILGDQIRELLPDLPPENLLEEPLGRNTAPAIGWAATVIARRDPGALMAVLPADHHIADEAGFVAAVGRTLIAAQRNQIVTLGIQPTRPETGYGYIQVGDPVGDDAFAVTAFREKPDLETALTYLAQGGSLWNAGMFFMPAELALSEIGRHEPELYQGLQALDSEDGHASSEQIAAVYPTLKSISIDYAVAERSDRVVVVRGDFGWSDVGSWRTLWDFRAESDSTFSHGATIEIDGGNNVLFADGGTVATVGVRDLIVVHTHDATLVAPRDDAQRVREVVNRLREAGREDLL